MICNEIEGGSARDAATWRKAPCERAAAAASPFSCSARGCSVCSVQIPGGSSNSITVMENTDQSQGSEMARQGNSCGPKRVLCNCFREGGGKMELFDLPGFCVLLAGIALYNFYECVPVVKTRPGPYGLLRSEDFCINIYLSLLPLCSLF
jgi:hypothetical protein